jgi:hypothetical protein
MHRLHVKYAYQAAILEKHDYQAAILEKHDYQAAILEKQLRAISPELMAGSTSNFNHRYIYLLGISYGFFTRGEQYGPGHFIQNLQGLTYYLQCSNIIPVLRGKKVWS